MPITSVIPVVAALGFVAITLSFALARSPARLTWPIPLTLSVAFLAFSVWSVIEEGPTGFWPVHTANLWGNQVWLDLLLAVTVGWVLILPRAKAVGMSTGWWLVAIVLSGSIAFLAMLARLLFLEQRAGAHAERPQSAEVSGVR